ncbi:hypothetical protein KQX54_006189 [Cotesia glomerata]|uniref:Uncharacterized protein n=1 Tax=Cotesia glomerata TaxID=32391 RepID=A0AAV7HPN5_COTGL|nr:hypothetical protein KQX54_006189 [Cotesia glomerata]
MRTEVKVKNGRFVLVRSLSRQDQLLELCTTAIIRDPLDRSWTQDIYRYDVNPEDFIASNGPRFSFLNKNHTFPFGKPEGEEEEEEEE